MMQGIHCRVSGSRDSYRVTLDGITYPITRTKAESKSGKRFMDCTAVIDGIECSIYQPCSIYETAGETAKKAAMQIHRLFLKGVGPK